MELRVLRYFLAVAREGSITRAAEKLHITQPTLSRQLMQLEEDLGASLFHRNNHRITLTEDGMLLKRRAQELLELAEKTQREFQSMEELSGEIAIGCGETRNMAFLSDLMVSFREQHPLVQFRIRTATADDVKERIEKGLLDMGLLLEPVETSHYDSIRMPQEENWGALVREDSPLAEIGSASPKALLDWPLLLPWRESVNSQLMGWFGKDYKQIQIAARFDFTFNAAIMVKHRMGVALCHDKETAFFPNLRMVPLLPKLENGAVLVWKKDLPRSRAVEQFIAHIRNTTFRARTEME